jgi:hypothetical protein
MDAMEFFRQSAGRWRSQRTIHHLAFKRAELGQSEIIVESVEAGDPDLIELCTQHDIEPSLAVGGCRVRWAGAMGWDKEGENHEGKTVFVLVPDEGNPRAGRLVRERGYAEIVPVVGRYHMDEQDALVLSTEYDTMTAEERFWFVNPNLRCRSSAVKRYGGFSTASFCTEARVEQFGETDTSTEQISQVEAMKDRALLSPLGW